MKSTLHFSTQHLSVIYFLSQNYLLIIHNFLPKPFKHTSEQNILLVANISQKQKMYLCSQKFEVFYYQYQTQYLIAFISK